MHKVAILKHKMECEWESVTLSLMPVYDSTQTSWLWNKDDDIHNKKAALNFMITPY